MSTRWLLLTLFALFGLLQYRLWIGDGSLAELYALKSQLAAYQADLEQLDARNRALAAEVESLKTGLSAIEERARTELGMIRDGELFLQVVEQPASASIAPPTPIPENP